MDSWVEIEEFWVNEFQRLLFTGPFIQYWDRYKNLITKRNSIQAVNLDSEKAIALSYLNEYYTDKNWPYFLYMLEMKDLYSNLSFIDDLEAILKNVYVYIAGDKSASDFNAPEMYIAVRKMTALFFLQENDIVRRKKFIHYLERKIKLFGQQRTDSLSQKNQYYIEIYKGVSAIDELECHSNDVRLRLIWNTEKNLFPKPLSLLYSGNEKVFFKCYRGHEWSDSLENVLINLKNDSPICPHCNNQEEAFAFTAHVYESLGGSKEFFKENILSVIDYVVSEGKYIELFKICNKLEEFLNFIYEEIITCQSWIMYDYKWIKSLYTIVMIYTFRDNQISVEVIDDIFGRVKKKNNFLIFDNKINDFIAEKSSWILFCDKAISYALEDYKMIRKGKDDLLIENTYLLKYWDIMANGVKVPYNLIYAPYDAVWWKCPTCGAKWKQTIQSFKSTPIAFQ